MATFGAGAGGATKLSGLTDVNTGASPADASVLVFSTTTGVWGAGTVVSGNTIALAGISDVTGTSTEGLALLRKSSGYGFGQLGSGAIANDAVTAAKIPSKGIPLGKISAGTSTTDGHVLTVSGSTGDVVAEAIPAATIAQVFGITASPAANQIIKRNSANDAWTFAADATGGGGGGGSIPEKAGPADWAAGTNDEKYLTVLGAATMEKSADNGTEWAFTYNATDGTNTMRVYEAGSPPEGDLFKFSTTTARAVAMDAIITRNSPVRFTRDASNFLSGRADYAYRNGSDFYIKVKAGFSLTGTIASAGAAITVRGEGVLFGELKDQGFITSSDLVEGTDIELTIGNDGRVTISYSGTGGVDYANQTEVNAGTITNKAVNPATLHGALDAVPHVAPFPGFEHTTSTGASMPLGSWNINSDGTVAHYRAHTDEQHAAMFAEFAADKRCQQESSRGEIIDYEFSATPTEHSIDGQAVGYIKCTIGSHVAIPSNPSLAGDWSVNVMPDQNAEVFQHAPARSIKSFALAKGAVDPVVASGMVQETRMFMDNDGSGARRQRISPSATTDFGTGTTTSDSAHNVKSWAIGGGSNTGEHFDQKRNMTLLPGTLDFSGFRAEAGNLYSIFLDGLGTLFCGAADNVNLPVAVEVGLAFRDKAPTETDWQSWAHCGNSDVSRTIGGVSTVVYDASNFYGDANFLSNQNKVIFRTKGTLYGSVNGTNFYADVSPPFWACFEVGDSNAAFPVADRDYQFRFVFRAADVGSGLNGVIDRIYNYTERLLARRA